MQVFYVNKEDKVIGSGSIVKAVEDGIIVRIARVFIINPKGEILLQKHSADHPSLPNRWDQSAAGHVDVGENYVQAAYRELKEEMGIRATTLVKLNKYYAEENDELKTKKRFSTLYVGNYDGPVEIDQQEVSDFRWLKPEDLDKEMSEHPENFTEGAINAFRVFQKYKTNLGLLSTWGK